MSFHHRDTEISQRFTEKPLRTSVLPLCLCGEKPSFLNFLLRQNK